MNVVLLLIFGTLIAFVKSDLKIEVMKEGLLDLKTTILRSPNVTEFTGSAQESYIGGTSGELVPFFPSNGCEELQETPGFTTKDEKSGKFHYTTVNGKSEQVIVLISRGGCPFNTKFLNAKKIKGVVGVLVYNGPGDVIPVEKIALTNDSEDLPGFLISDTLGLELYNKLIKYRGSSISNSAKSIMNNSMTMNDSVKSASISASSGIAVPYIEITMTPVSIDATNRANTMIQMALIAIIIILALSFGASIVIHMRSPALNNGNTNDGNHEESSLIPIDVEFLQKLPLKTFKGRRRSVDSTGGKNDDGRSDNNTKYTANMHGGIKSPTVKDEKCASSPKSIQENEWFEMIQHDWPMNDSCPICLDEFNQNEVLNELPCGHCYHIACIQPWLQYRSPCCPLCKLDVREEFRPEFVKGSVENNTMNSASASTSSTSTKAKIQNIWNKLILKSSSTSTSNTNEMTQIQPAMSTSIPIDNGSENTISNVNQVVSSPLQIPQRALVQESEGFHSVPLRE